MTFNCGKYLCGESAEVYIPIPADISTSLAMSRIQSHAHHVRRKASCSLLYCCDREGHGLRIIRVILDEPVKKMKQGRPLGKKNKPERLELLEAILGGL